MPLLEWYKYFQIFYVCFHCIIFQVEAARQCTEYPHDIKYQDQLRRTAEDLRDVTIVAATTPALRAKLVDRVHVRCLLIWLSVK